MHHSEADSAVSRRTVLYRKVNMPPTGRGFMKRMAALFQGTREVAQWVENLL